LPKSSQPGRETRAAPLKEKGEVKEEVHMDFNCSTNIPRTVQKKKSSKKEGPGKSMAGRGRVKQKLQRETVIPPTGNQENQKIRGRNSNTLATSIKRNYKNHLSVTKISRENPRGKWERDALPYLHTKGTRGPPNPKKKTSTCPAETSS